MRHDILCALVGNASSLAFHWIYDQDYLTQLAQTETLAFQTRKMIHYQKAKVSYDAYPDMQLGDVTVQGVILKALVTYLGENSSIDLPAYETLIYQTVGPGSGYKGYIESYLKKAWTNRYLKEFHMPLAFTLQDDHLISMVPFLAFEDKESAKSLIFAFSDKEDYHLLFDFWAKVLDEKSGNFADAIQRHLSLLKGSLHENIKAAMSNLPLDVFLKNHAGSACSIYQSMPLMAYLLARFTDYETLLEDNLKIGGACADRAMFLSYVLSSKITLLDSWKRFIK